MTPGARVQAAIEILDAIEGGTAAEQALTGWARRSRFAGSKDRAAVRDHVFQALRCRMSYAALGGGLSGRALMIGALRSNGTDPSDVFTAEGHAPAMLSPMEMGAGHPPKTAAETHDLPDWLVARFAASLGDQALPQAQMLRDRAPVCLRVNLAKGTRDAARAHLADDGILSDPVPLVDTALIVTEGARKLAQHPAYTDGLVELQDAASQAAMATLAIAPGARVLDYCAGGGGKTLALAARHSAQWYAHDVDPARMKDLGPRAARAGQSVQPLKTADITRAAPYDLVLCDVPCSGSGTWRRAPEAKWRLTPARLDTLCGLQADILGQARDLVRPGGTIAYATCSVLREENEDQIAAFLDTAPDWRLDQQTRWKIAPDHDGFFLTTLIAPQP